MRNFRFSLWETACAALSIFVLSDFALATPTLYNTPGLTASQQSSLYQVTIGQEPLTVYQTRPPTQRLCNYKGCDGADAARADNRTMAWTNFSFSAPTNIVIKKSLSNALADIEVRPSAGAGIDYNIVRKDLAAGEIEVQVITKNSKLSVEYIDDRYDNFRELPKDGLLVFADQDEALDTYPTPDKNSPDTYVVSYPSQFDKARAALAKAIYFEPGVHELGYWQVPASVMHVYLAGGAYILGAIDSAVEAKREQKGFKVTGRGILSGEAFPWRADKRTNGLEPCRDGNGATYDCWFNAVKLLQLGTDQFFLQGVTLVNAPHWVISGFRDNDIVWHTHDAAGNDDPSHDPLGTGIWSEEKYYSGKLLNFKILGNWRWNNDGAAVQRNTEVKDCFISAFDDAFKTFNSGGSVKNCVVWHMDNGAVFQLGWFVKDVKSLVVEDIDVIHAEWTGLNQNWGLVNFADRGWNGQAQTIKNSLFKDIRIEGPATRVIGIENKVVTKQSFNTITFENIHVDHLVTPAELPALAQQGNGAIDPGDVNYTNPDVRPPNIVNGASSEATVTGIVIKRLFIDGQRITTVNAGTQGQFKILGNATQVTFDPPPSPGC